MTSQSSFTGSAAAQRPTVPIIVLLTAKEAAKLLKVSLSWLAKARMRGDGPPYIPVGRSIRYSEAALLQWMKAAAVDQPAVIGPASTARTHGRKRTPNFHRVFA
jgi:excisionase family DNA binding protein